MNNKQTQPARKVVNSWLSGKIKCARCGYGLKSMQGRLYCNKRKMDRSCEGCGGTIRTPEMEATIYNEMVLKLREFHTLTESEKSAGNPKVTALKVEIAQVEAEIEKLLETLLGGSDILMSYANTKIAELDSRRQKLSNQLADITAVEVPYERMLKLSDVMDDWENASIESKREVIDSMIMRIDATSENFDIRWKI